MHMQCICLRAQATNSIPVQASNKVYIYATNTHAGLLMPAGEPLCLRDNAQALSHQ